MGNHHSKSFPKDEEYPFELIHSDIYGAMATSSLEGAMYFLPFIDNYSQILWVYTIKSKDEVYGKFLGFKTLIQAQCKERIMCLRIYGGGEYIANVI
jgi:hypothetical protein